MASSNLEECLHQHDIASLLTRAALIREWPALSERRAAAERMIRHVMVEVALHRIAELEKDAVFALLDVALPPHVNGECTFPIDAEYSAQHHDSR